MKRIISLVIAIAMILGMVNTVCAEEDYYEQQYPGYGEYARAMNEVIYCGTVNFCAGRDVRAEHIDSYYAYMMIAQMYNYYSLKYDNPKKQELIRKYCDENTPMMVATENDIDCALVHRFSMSLEQVMEIANREQETIFIRDGYVFCPQTAQGYPDAELVIDELSDLNENMKYAIWHLDYEDDIEDSRKYYSVMESKMLNNKKFVVYHYLSYDKPSDEYLASFSAQPAKPSEISVVINGEKITFDQPPEIVNDRTMVPLRAIFEELGAEVEWNAETRTVTGTLGNIIFSLAIGDDYAYKNGIKIYLDSPAIIVNDRTLVPVRVVSESFGCEVGWDGDTRTVSIEGMEKMNQSDILKRVSVDFDKDGVKETVYFVGEKSWQEPGYGKVYDCDVYFGNALMLDDVCVLAENVKTVDYDDCNQLYFQTYATVQKPTYVLGVKNGRPHFYFYGNMQGDFDKNNVFKGEIAKSSEDTGRYFEKADYKWNGSDYVSANTAASDWFEAYKNHYNANVKGKPTGLVVETGDVPPSSLVSIDMIDLDNDDSTYPDMILTYCHDDISVSKVFSIDNNLNVRETTVTYDNFSDSTYYFMKSEGKNYYVEAAIPAGMVILHINEYSGGAFKELFSVEMYDRIDNQTPYGSDEYIWIDDEYCYSCVVYDADRNIIKDSELAKSLYKRSIGNVYDFSYVAEFDKDAVVKYEPTGGVYSPASKETVFINYGSTAVVENNSSKTILMHFLNNEFETQKLSYYDDAYNKIGAANTVSEHKQKILADYFIDMNGDGDEELVIKSSPIGSETDYWNVVSIWDCDSSGNVIKVLAKSGYASRSTCRYFIAKYNGEIYLLETTGMSNSTSNQSERSAYRYINGSMEPVYTIFYYENYHESDKNIFVINGQDYSLEAAKKYLEDFDNNIVRLFNATEDGV